MAGLTHDELVDMMALATGYRDAVAAFLEQLEEYCTIGYLATQDEDYDQALEDKARKLRDCFVLIKKGDIL